MKKITLKGMNTSRKPKMFMMKDRYYSINALLAIYKFKLWYRIIDYKDSITKIPEFLKEKLNFGNLRI